MSAERPRIIDGGKGKEPLGLGTEKVGILGPEKKGTENKDKLGPGNEEGEKKGKLALLADLFPGQKESQGKIDGKVVKIEKGKIV